MKACTGFLTILMALSMNQKCFAKTFVTPKTDGKASLVQMANKAAETGDKAALAKILNSKKFDINAQDSTGMTPLMAAAIGGDVEIIEQLLKRKAKLEIKNSAGDTALAVAVTNDQLTAANKLIELGANVDLVVSGEDGDTLLIIAAANDAKTTQAIFQKNKSVLNKSNKSGETALMKSVIFGNNESLKVLLQAGADKTLKNKEGQTALDMARQSYNKEAIKLLKKQ